jgi:hypothetical protein
MPDKSFNPIGVCQFGAQAVVFQPNLAPDLVQQTRCRSSFGMHRYGIHFLGLTKNVQLTDEYQLITMPGFLYSQLDG